MKLCMHSKEIPMSKIILFFLILYFSIFYACFASEAETLRFATIDYCPFTCDPLTENGKEGFMTDVVRMAFEPAGYNIEIDMLPYARALSVVQGGKYDGIIVVGKNSAPTLIYPEIPTVVQKVAFFTRESESWTYSGQESLSKVRIGIIKGYDYSGDNELSTYISQNNDTGLMDILHGQNTTERGIKMLLNKRIDAYVEGEYAVLYYLSKMQIRDQIKIADYTSELFEDYTGFSSHHPLSFHLAEILTNKIAELNQSGELDRIVGRYVNH